MKQLFLFILLMLEVSNGALYAQSCAGSPLFRQGKQWVFLVETSPQSVAFKGPSPIGKNTPTLITRKKNTYTTDSVTNLGNNVSGAFKLTKSEDFSTGAFNKANAAPPGDPTYIFNNVSCNGHMIYYTMTIRSARTNGTYVMEYPLDMKVGDKLKDSGVEGKGGEKKNGGYSVLSQRTVTGQEVVTTPAGTWNCFKIAETFTTVTPGTNGSHPTAITGPTPDYTWFAPEIGIVKMTAGTWFTMTLISLP